jgi:hypothetical protein
MAEGGAAIAGIGAMGRFAVHHFRKRRFPRTVGYAVSMDYARENDRANLKAWIGLWEEEEKRLRSITKDPQTSPLIKDQADEKLGLLVAQLQALADELAAIEQTHLSELPS